MFACLARRSAPLPLIALVSVITACAGKGDVSAIEVEQQAFDDLRTEIRNVIDDPWREMEALALTDELIAALDQLRDRVSERRRHVMALYENYDTTREEFEAFFEEIEADIQTNRMELIETERALLALLTPEERASLEKVETKAMKAAIKTIQAI